MTLLVDHSGFFHDRFSTLSKSPGKTSQVAVGTLYRVKNIISDSV